jgi:predicted alpha/beta hydrolase
VVGDLPRHVAWQWRRWCLDPEYLVGALPGARERFAAISSPLTSFSLTDDELMSEANIRSIHGFYSGAERRMVRLSPAELGASRVGHFGFFRAEMEAPLWEAQLLPELAV